MHRIKRCKTVDLDTDSVAVESFNAKPVMVSLLCTVRLQSALFLVLALSGLTLAGTMGCSSAQVSESNSAEAAFNAAEEFEKDERYEEALAKFNEVKNKHPYSRFATESELHVADIQYKREAFFESQNAYQLFKDFHPKNPKIDYVTFRLAMSYYMQLPPSSDRDLAPATKAIQFFNEVINAYPSSPYVKESQDKKLETLKMLADKESYIGNFYYIRNIYDSARRRYDGLLLKYPNLGFDEEALYRSGICAYETSDKVIGEKRMNELIARFPEGDYTKRAKSALEKYGSH